MSLSAKLRRAPLRATTGAYILNSGVGKLSADDDTAKAVHGMASGSYPFLGKVQPKVFVRGLAVGEIAIGGALLLPIVPPVVAGAALAGFSGALLKVYWDTPGMHEEGSPRPTVRGVPMSKDVWMAGAGIGLLADALLEPAHDKKVVVGAAVAARRGRKARKARKAAKNAAKNAKGQEAVALAAASSAAHAAAGWLASARDEYGPVAADKAKQAREGARHIAEEYGPVAADKAKQSAKKARKAARELADEYGPVAADKAKQSAKKARKAARELADEYGPVAAAKTEKARKAVLDLADEYGPVAAERAAKARQAARDLADEYGPIAAEKAKIAAEKARQAREAAEAAAARLQASVR